MTRADSIIAILERYRRTLQLELGLVDFSDDDYRKWHKQNGYVAEGQRGTRPRVERYLAIVDGLLTECRARLDAQDEGFFVALHSYSSLIRQEEVERIEPYSMLNPDLFRKVVAVNTQRAALPTINPEVREKVKALHAELVPSGQPKTACYRQIATELGESVDRVRYIIEGPRRKKK